MMKNPIVIAVLIVLGTLVACQDLSTKHVTGEYYLVVIDVKDDMHLSYSLDKSGGSVGVVGPTVFAIGYDDSFIIAKQHPRMEFKTDKSVTNYYIVPLKFKVHKSPDENRIGPLTKTEFEAKRKELRVSDNLKFTKVFKDLE